MNKKGNENCAYQTFFSVSFRGWNSMFLLRVSGDSRVECFVLNIEDAILKVDIVICAEMFRNT